MIHAVVQAFNTASIKQFLRLCFQVWAADTASDCDKPLHCSHTEADKHEIEQSAETKIIFLYSFAHLQV